MMPFTPRATGEARATAGEDDTAFVSLLETEAGVAETPAGPATLQSFSTTSPALQLQTIASTGTDDGAGDPTAAPTQVAGASAALNGSDGSASPSTAVTAQQSAAAARTIPPATDATEADTDVSDASADEVGATSAAPASAAPGDAFSVLPAATVGMVRAHTDASAAAPRPAVATPEPATASDTAPADVAEATPANAAGRTSATPTPTPNQPAAAAAAAQSAPAPNDAALVKQDFAAVLASQSEQGGDTQAQTISQPREAARATPTPAALQAAPAATVQVYNRIVERVDGRAQRFEIRLDPAELGRVDVRIEIGADRKVHAVLAAHDSAALSDLMRGQRALERALADAGIDLADKGVRFELARDNGSNSANQQRNSDGRPAQADVWRRFDTLTMPTSEETAAAVRPSWHPQRLDLVA